MGSPSTAQDQEPQQQKTDGTTPKKQVAPKNLVGLTGWLAIFVVTLFVSIVLTVINLFKDGLSLTLDDVSSLNNYQSGLGDTFQTLTSLENVALLVYIGLLIAAAVQILRRRKAGKILAIVALTYLIVYSLIDYGVTNSLVNSTSLNVGDYLSSYTSTLGRNFIYVLVWVPYLLFSRRVKATLTK